jgi:tellurite resistance protein
MAHSPTGLKLPEVDPARRLAAVRAVLARQSTDMPKQVVEASALIGRLPSKAKLRVGAEQAQKEEAEDLRAAEYFQSLLELGYLVASADGLAADERETLALLLEHATDAAVNRDVLQLHFFDLEATCAALGRSERLSRVAANLDTPSAREEAISFAALVAMADGSLEPAEVQVLIELGRHFSLSAAQVESLAGRVAESIRQQLAG